MPSLSQPPAVLLVEDSDDDAFFFQRALRLSGFACELTHLVDGGATIEHLTKAAAGGADAPRRPDLVFLDLKVPTANGFDVLEWARSQAFEQPLDIAVLSGSEHAGDVERALSLGATAYYVKPILVQQLKARFEAWQQKHGTRDLATPVAGRNGTG
jgi:DNA-binding response OmpR family regulator